MNKVYVLVDKNGTPLCACLCEEGAIAMMAKIYHAVDYKIQEMSKEEQNKLNKEF